MRGGQTSCPGETISCLHEGFPTPASDGEELMSAPPKALPDHLPELRCWGLLGSEDPPPGILYGIIALGKGQEWGWELIFIENP